MRTYKLTHPTCRTPRRLPMDQLRYFVGMTKCTLNSSKYSDFWQMMRENCPELMQAIEASFMKEYERVTFTNELISPAFDPDLLSESEEEVQS